MGWLILGRERAIKWVMLYLLLNKVKGERAIDKPRTIFHDAQCASFKLSMSDNPHATRFINPWSQVWRKRLLRNCNPNHKVYLQTPNQWTQFEINTTYASVVVCWITTTHETHCIQNITCKWHARWWHRHWWTLLRQRMIGTILCLMANPLGLPWKEKLCP